ncbi:Glutathione S-transferase 1 [Cytospora mali]|uniref:Glutathione S-transferase 1 n=1 Tax=Cytospora mali TaxID=578113 RepID=A0A194V991_CYTMA|nr:Glutathione S-transferase 1 [Valsa mali var. pyri (nom. inval.)]
MSSSQLKPIKVYGKGGPNPPKVAMVLEELGLPHDIIPIDFPDLKKPDYLAINPNGRMPAIYDPNTDLTLWESGAIIEYLVERYDTAHKISFQPGTAEAAHAKQWLFFQVSGQGPYYGQAVWFKKYHPENLPSAFDRYAKEIARVTGVLEGHLGRQKEAGVGGADGPWLVGGKFSYADLAFLSWQDMVVLFAGKEVYNADEFPLVSDWIARLRARPALKKVMDELYASMGLSK